MEQQDLFGQLAVAKSSPQKPKGKKTSAEKVGEQLESIERLESEIRRLEEGIPPLFAQFEAVERPLVKEIVQARRKLIALVEAAIGEDKRQRKLREKGIDLVLHLAFDLEERFGEEVAGIVDRWVPPEKIEPAGPHDESTLESTLEFFEAIIGRAVPGPIREAMREQLRSGQNESPPELQAWLGSLQAEEAGSIPPPPPPRGRKSKTAVDSEATARSIYRNLARELHPDKTRDEEERLRRTELMQNLTRAWQERDLGALLRLLHAHGSDEVKAGSMDEQTLKACLRELKETASRLERRRRELRHENLPFGSVDWLVVLENPSQMELLLRRAREVPRAELADVRRMERLWSDVDEVLLFLKVTNPDDWDRMI